MTDKPIETPLTIEAIFAGLRNVGPYYPRRELKSAVAQREAITPHLIAHLEAVVRDPETFADDEDDFTTVAALFLLAQFRENRAYRAVVDLFSLPGDVLDALLADLLTERGSMMLAQVSGGDPALIQQLAENQDADEYARMVALGALITLVAHGEWSREAAMAYFACLFAGGLEREPSGVWEELVNACMDLHPGELMPDIRAAYAEELVDVSLQGELAEVEAEEARDVAAVMAELPHLREHRPITDVIAETEWWSSFNPPVPVSQQRPTVKPGKAKAKKAKRKMAKASKRKNR